LAFDFSYLGSNSNDPIMEANDRIMSDMEKHLMRNDINAIRLELAQTKQMLADLLIILDNTVHSPFGHGTYTRLVGILRGDKQ
jgi:hypothetical protein